MEGGIQAWFTEPPFSAPPPLPFLTPRHRQFHSVRIVFLVASFSVISHGRRCRLRSELTRAARPTAQVIDDPAPGRLDESSEDAIERNPQ
jgi:hypothetical protein